MTTHVIKNKSDIQNLATILHARRLPVTVTVINGKHRSNEQNNLQWLWMNEAAEQLGEYTAEQYRGYCKLHYGVPILRAENEEFKRQYDRVVRPLSYENKLAIMQVPLDLPVTRLMSTGQAKRYLDDVYHFFDDLGVKLTSPDET